MTVEHSFRSRMKGVRAYLRSLKELERNYLAPGRSFYRARAAIDASRASAFIMLYNCIEYAVREAIASLRFEIEASGRNFDDLLLHWKQEIMEAHFEDALRQGTNHSELLRSITAFMPGMLTWRTNQDKLPFPGNVDQVRLFRYVKSIGYTFKPPKSSLGGTDLVLIKQSRNDLAHGAETFEDVGARYSTDDMINKLDRARDFTIAFVKAVERYKARQLYIKH